MLTRLNVTTYFCLGWFLMIMLPLVGVGSRWATFIHIWQFELPAAVFLAACCFYFITRPSQNIKPFSRAELGFIIAPIVLFICWSAFSALWAPSWKSAIHHALVWVLYLIFYLVVRQILETEKGLRYLGLTLLILVAIPSYAAVAGYISLLVFGGSNSLGMHAKYGEQIVTILPLILVAVTRTEGRRFWIGAALITLLWLLIFCSFGRINLFLFGIAFLTTAALVVLTQRSLSFLGKASDGIEDNNSSGPAGPAISELKNRSPLKKLVIVAAAVVLSPVLVQMFTLLSDKPEAAPVAFRRLGDDESLASSNNFRKLMIVVSKEMIAAHPFVGIGGDNFGFQVNEYRTTYSAKHPEEVSLREAEDNLPERAHNELLQIIAELGIVGGAIALWIVAGILMMAWRGAHRLTTHSLLGPAAVIGLGMFLVSSLVSSYSFRLIQNGFVFFFVLAVAAKYLMKEGDSSTLTRPRVRILSAAGLVCCLLLVAYWTIRLASVYHVNEANYTQNLVEAERHYSLAQRLDDENADAPYYRGIRLFQKEQYSDSVPYMAEAIHIGRARSVDFSYLASAQRLGGDTVGAELTMARALELYPRSVFVLMRYADLLKANGKEAECAAMLERARSLNRRDANSWWTFLNEGSNAAATLAFRDPAEYTPLMDLYPLNGVYAFRHEREIRFPEEKMRLFDQMLNPEGE
jgi:O-antigen ligase